MTHVEQILEMLDLQANEEFEIEPVHASNTYRLTEDLELQYKTRNGDWAKNQSGTWLIFNNLILGKYKIVKHAKASELEMLQDEIMTWPYDYRLTSDGEVCSVTAPFCNGDEMLQGNAGTYDEMQFLKEKRQVEAEIRFLQKMKMPLNNKWDGIQQHWYASYNMREKVLVYECSAYDKDSVFYFSAKEYVQEMIAIVGEDRYVKYILEVQEETEECCDE